MLAALLALGLASANAANSWNFSGATSKAEVALQIQSDPGFALYANAPGATANATVNNALMAQFSSWAAAFGLSFSGSAQTQAFANWKSNMAQVRGGGPRDRVRVWHASGQP